MTIKAIINVEIIVGKKKVILTKTLASVPLDALSVVRCIVEEAAKRHGNLTLSGADLLIVANHVSLPINNLTIGGLK